MRILKLLKVSAAALVVFSVCGRSVADPAGNPDLSQLVRNLPSSGGTTAPLPEECSAPGVIALPEQLPVYWDRPDSPTFTYRFQIQFATEPHPSGTHPVGIVLPGGAGAPTIGKLPPGRVFPRTFHVIYTDVRGVGCNVNSHDPANPFPADALTTDYFSRDVLAVVQRLRLSTYVLFGISYGTVHATVMTNIAEREGIPAPSALVLEGILGNWWLNADEVVDYNKEWNQAKTLLSPGVVSAFQAISPYGISSREWMVLLTQTLNAGTTPLRGNNTYFYLHKLDTTDQAKLEEAIATIKAEIALITASYSENTYRVATILHCTETSGSVYTKDLVNGEIVNIPGSDVCPLWGLRHIRPWNSADYPVTVPIYYFEGSQDPNTSPANAYHHFANQTRTNRLFTLVLLGGHTDMSDTLHQMGCTPAIFEAIAMNNSTALGAALRQCRWGMWTEIRRPGQ